MENIIKVKIYTIHSSLHNEEILNDSTIALIKSLEGSNIRFSFENDLEKLYKDSDLSLILVQSGGSENLFLENFSNFKEPYYLLTYGANNSLAASLEILAFLKNRNLEGEVLHGDSKYLEERIKFLAKKPAKPYSKINLGIIGKPSDWLISSDVNKEKALNIFGINLIDIPIEELIITYNSLNEVDNPDYWKKVKFDKKEISKAEKLYEAIKIIVQKYDLKGFTIRCFDLLTSVKTTACLALSKFNDEEIIATCEGDVPSLIGMYLLKNELDLLSFQANPSNIDVNQNKIVLAHCTVPLKMCTSYSLDTHFESGIGVAIHGEIKEGEATIFRMNSSLSKFFVESGAIKKNTYLNNLCRTQIVCKFNNLDKILRSPLGNHELIVLGNHKEEIAKLLQKYGLENN